MLMTNVFVFGHQKMSPFSCKSMFYVAGVGGIVKSHEQTPNEWCLISKVLIKE